MDIGARTFFRVLFLRGIREMDVVLVLLFFTVPIWAVVLCVNFVAILQKLKYEEDHPQNTFWFTVAGTVLICQLFLLLAR